MYGILYIMKWQMTLGILIVAVGIFILARNYTATTETPSVMGTQSNSKGLTTDYSKTSIDTTKLLSGGPGKDGIPALNNPTFVAIGEEALEDEVQGVFVERGTDKRFYPYNILVWHEIVNDTIGGEPLAITFCPLCGSAIVFDRVVGGRTLTLGVSGLLYESNLVMFDRETESLWSQVLGRAVVGELLGTELEIESMSVLTYKVLKAKYPDAKVLSQKTGHPRNYTIYPYGDYDENDDIYFPVSVTDARYQAKTIMYVTPFDGRSFAFPITSLPENDKRSVESGGTRLTLFKQDGEITVTTQGGKNLPGYYEMWFSWATHHQADGVVIGL